MNLEVEITVLLSDRGFLLLQGEGTKRSSYPPQSVGPRLLLLQEGKPGPCFNNIPFVRECQVELIPAALRWNLRPAQRPIW